MAVETPPPAKREPSDTASGPSHSPADVTHELAVGLGKAALALGEAGHPNAANRIVARTYAAIWRDNDQAARRLNGIMHSLCRMPDRSAELHQHDTKETNMSVTPLDVRSEPPARRHELIFESFAKLEAGNAFELINDHDPKPLYYQLEAEETGKFSWEYVEQGPEVWRVQIGRTA